MKKYLFSQNCTFYLLTSIILISPLFAGGTTYASVTGIRALTLIALIIIAFNKDNKKESISLNLSALSFCIMTLFSLFIISTFFLSPSFYDSLQWTMCIANYGGIYIICRNMPNYHVRKYWIASFIIVSASIEAVYGIIKYLTLNEPRAVGTFFNPNFFSLYLGVSSVIIISILFFKNSNNCQISHRALKTIFSTSSSVIILLFLVSGIIFSASRGGALALLITLILLSFLRFRFKALIVLPLILAILFFIPNPLKTRIETSYSHDIFGFSRTGIWESAYRMFVENPWGIGTGMYKYYFPKYNFPVEGTVARFSRHAVTAHNEYLQFLAEMGIQGLLILIILFLLFIKKLRPFFSRCLGEKGYGLETGILGGLLVIVIHCMFDSSLHDYTAGIMLSILAAMLINEAEMLSPPKTFNLKVSFLFRWIISFPLVILILLSLLFCGGQFYKDQGITYNKASQYNIAEEQFTKSLLLMPFDSETFNARANLWFNKFLDSKDVHYLDKSLVDESTAISLNRINSSFYYYSGKIISAFPSEKNSRYYLTKSLTFFEAAKELSPYNPFYRIELVSIFAKVGETERAEAEAKKLLNIEPDFLPALESLYWLYEKSSEKDKSRKILADIKEKFNDLKNQQNLSDYEKSFFKLSTELKQKL